MFSSDRSLGFSRFSLVAISLFFFYFGNLQAREREMGGNMQSKEDIDSCMSTFQRWSAKDCRKFAEHFFINGFGFGMNRSETFQFLGEFGFDRDTSDRVFDTFRPSSKGMINSMIMLCCVCALANVDLETTLRLCFYVFDFDGSGSLSIFWVTTQR